MAAGRGPPQYEWLLDDLDQHPAERFPCTLAFWHDPRFMWVEWWRSDDGPRGPVPAVRPLWEALDDADAELTLGGNAHNYERWTARTSAAPSTPQASRSSSSARAVGNSTMRDLSPALRRWQSFARRRVRRARTATSHRELPMAVALGAWGAGVPGRGNRRLSLTRSHAQAPDPDISEGIAPGRDVVVVVSTGMQGELQDAIDIVGDRSGSAPEAPQQRHDPCRPCRP